jgi:hypothetical protein
MNTIPEALAPSTFRIPISFFFCSAENETSPKSPRQAMMIASVAKTTAIDPIRSSD